MLTRLLHRAAICAILFATPVTAAEWEMERLGERTFSFSAASETQACLVGVYLNESKQDVFVSFAFMNESMVPSYEETWIKVQHVSVEGEPNWTVYGDAVLSPEVPIADCRQAIIDLADDERLNGLVEDDKLKTAETIGAVMLHAFPAALAYEQEHE